MRPIQVLHFRIAVCLLLLLFSTASGLAQAQNAISLKAGSFTPFHGTTGTSSTFQYTHQLGARQHLGAENEYRNFQGELAGVNGVDLGQIVFRVFYRVDLLADKRVTPYLALGMGGGWNEVDDRDIERPLNRRSPDSQYKFESASLLDVVSVVGLDVAVPQADWASLFGEARFSHTEQTTRLSIPNPDPDPGWFAKDRVNRDRDDDVSGIAAQVGVPFKF